MFLCQRAPRIPMKVEIWNPRLQSINTTDIASKHRNRRGAQMRIETRHQATGTVYNSNLTTRFFLNVR